MDGYYNAAIPKPWTILGLRLRPLSLGHISLLNRVGSAFVVGGKVTYEDLAISVFICANSYADGVAALDDADLPRQFLRWSQALTRTRWVDRLLRRKPTPIDLSAKAAMFADYVREGSWCPTYSTSDESQPISLPPEHLVRVLLMRDLGFSEAELMDRSWSRCLTDLYTLRALEGRLQIMPDPDSEEMQKMIETAKRMAKDS